MTAPEPEVCFNNWSNAAFTFQPPLPSKDPVFVQLSEDPNDVPNGGFYLKAKEGAFDETFFKDAGTGSFCFPNYSDRHTGMVYVGDVTNYKKVYPPASGCSIDKMERNFVTPEWEFRELREFIEDLPATCLKEGLSGKRLSSIFSNNYHYLNAGEVHAIKCELLSPNDPLIGYGFFVPADQSLFPPAKSWNAMSEEALAATCKENGIKPPKQKVPMIWQLMDNNIPFPLCWYKPTSSLISYIHSLVELYITDIRNSTDHFHPLYFASLWGELKGTFKEYFYLIKQFEEFTGFKVKVSSPILFRKRINRDLLIIHCPSVLLQSGDQTTIDLSHLGPAMNDPEIKKRKFRNEVGYDNIDPGELFFLVTDRLLYGLVQVVADDTVTSPLVPVRTILFLQPAPEHGIDFEEERYPIFECQYYGLYFKELIAVLDRQDPEMVSKIIETLQS